MSEAHASDKWAFNDNEYNIKQHVNLTERCEAAQTVMKLQPVNIPIVVDNMEDEAAGVYAALPEKLVIILDGKIVFMSGRGPFGYKLPKVEEYLNNFVQNKKNK